MAESKAFSVGAIFIGIIVTIFSSFFVIIESDYVCLWGLFIGIILVLAGIYDYFQADKREKQNMPSNKQDRYCPNCGRGIPFDARTCPYCSKKFEEF